MFSPRSLHALPRRRAPDGSDRTQFVRLLAVERSPAEAPHELDRPRAWREGHDPCRLQGLPRVRRVVSRFALFPCDEPELTDDIRYAERGQSGGARGLSRYSPTDRNSVPAGVPAARGARQVRISAAPECANAQFPSTVGKRLSSTAWRASSDSTSTSSACPRRGEKLVRV